MVLCGPQPVPALIATTVEAGKLPIRYNRDGTVALMSKPREARQFNGKPYLMEESIFGDVALVKVHKADRLGNCSFRKAQNNFNEVMAKNAKLTIVEADEIVEVGEIAPENIHIQGIYVDRVIKSTASKEIEKLIFNKDPTAIVKGDIHLRICDLELTIKYRDSFELQERKNHKEGRLGAEGRHVRQSWNRHTTCNAGFGS